MGAHYRARKTDLLGPASTKENKWCCGGLLFSAQDLVTASYYARCCEAFPSQERRARDGTDHDYGDDQVS